MGNQPRHDLVHALFPVDATDDRIFSCGVDDFAALPHHGHDHGPASARASNLLECVEVGIEWTNTATTPWDPTSTTLWIGPGDSRFCRSDLPQ